MLLGLRVEEVTLLLCTRAACRHLTKIGTKSSGSGPAPSGMTCK